jgi:hypothetical protein
MRMRGLEPPRAFAHTDLNRARLPIPPHPRGEAIVPAALRARFLPARASLPTFAETRGHSTPAIKTRAHARSTKATTPIASL